MMRGVRALVPAVAVLAGCAVAPAAFAAPQFSQQQLPVGAGASAMATADLNHDGHPDIVVADSGADSISVLLSHADGAGYDAAATYPVGDEPVAVTIGLVGSGAVPDIAVANHGDDTASVLQGNGDGTFQPSTGIPLGGGQGPVSIDIGDLPRPDATPGDGYGDLVLATPTSHDVTIAFLTASGAPDTTHSVAIAGSTPVAALVTATTDTFAPTAYGILIADQAADALDWVPAISGAYDCTGTPVPFTYPVEDQPASSCQAGTPTGFATTAADDVGAALQLSGLRRQPSTADGQERFVLLRAAAHAYSIVTARAPAIYTYVPGTLAVLQTIAASGAPNAVSTADLDGDGAGDVVTGLEGEARITAALTRNGASPDTVEVATPSPTRDATALDVDGNGHPDVVALLPADNAVLVARDRWPAASTGEARAVDTTTAVLTGSAVTRGLAGTSRFFVYTDTSPDSRVIDAQALPADDGTAVPSASLSGLRPGTVYRYRLGVSTDVGSSFGAERSFTTAGAAEQELPQPAVAPAASPYGCAAPALAPHAAIRAGVVVTLGGTDLGHAGSLTIGGVVARVVTWSPTRIQARVPVDAPSGAQPVVVSCGSGSAALTLSVKAAGTTRAAVLKRTVRGTTAALAIAAPAAGRLSVSGTHLGSRNVAVAKAGTVRLSVSLNSAGRRLLSRKHRLSIAVAVRFVSAQGAVASTVTHITFTKKGSAR